MSDHSEGRSRRDRGRRRRGGNRSGAPKPESLDSRDQPPKREAQGRGGAQGRKDQRRDPKARNDQARRDGRNRHDPGNRAEGASQNRPDALLRKDFGRPAQPRRERQIEVELPPPPVLPTPACPRCGEPIQDISSALTDRESGSPIHFDCALRFLEGAENVGEKEKIVYIGQGRFAVMEFENPSDLRKFRIVRTIEWESREHRAEWRGEIAGQYSQVR